MLSTSFAVVLAVMLILWFVASLRRNASIIDIFWGVGFVLIAWLSLLTSGQRSTIAWVLVAMVTIWGLRLAGYLAWRNLGKPEDYRYRAMRERHGRQFVFVSLFTVFGLQGVLMWIISLPIQVGVSCASGWHLGAVAGLSLWSVGLFFEAVGDIQLARFKADSTSRGRVMNRGLWRYTRHPNYFGDFLVWWGIYLVSLEPSTWWWTIVSPLIMSFLLVRVSGVRLLEESLKNRVEGYDEYVQTTSSFLPLPPKRTG